MKKLLIGCAVVAGIFVVLGIAASTILYSWFKRNAPDMDRVEAVRDEMREKYGDRDDFVPALDGRLQPERLEIFLSVREHLVQTRKEIAGRLDDFLVVVADRETRSGERSFFAKLRGGIDMARSGAALVREGVDYLRLRTEKLIDAGMGEGEYVYLYALLTYSWLQWDPVEAVGEDAVESLDLTEEMDEMRAEYRKILVRQLRNQVRELERKRDRSSDEELALKSVEAALESATADRSFPYEGTLPGPWLTMLEPVRERYVATLPRSPAEVLLDGASLVKGHNNGHGIQVNIE